MQWSTPSFFRCGWVVATVLPFSIRSRIGRPLSVSRNTLGKAGAGCVLGNIYRSKESGMESYVKKQQIWPAHPILTPFRSCSYTNILVFNVARCWSMCFVCRRSQAQSSASTVKGSRVKGEGRGCFLVRTSVSLDQTVLREDKRGRRL